MEGAVWPSLGGRSDWSRTGSFQSAASFDFEDVEDLRSFFDADDARTPRQAVLRIRTEVGTEIARELREQEVAASEIASSGERTYPDGSVYAGQLVGDDRHGQGRCIYPAGESPRGCDVYDGSWVDDR